jgi:hypothetical protein
MMMYDESSICIKRKLVIKVMMAKDPEAGKIGGVNECNHEPRSEGRPCFAVLFLSEKVTSLPKSSDPNGNI